MKRGHGESQPLPGTSDGTVPPRKPPALRRRSLALVAAGLLAACAPPHGPPAIPLPPLPLPAAHPLRSLGGLRLDRAVIGFGGLSGLHIGDDLQLTAVSDTGRWLRARLVLDATGPPQALAELDSGPLSDGLLLGLPGRFSLDAESLARLPDGRFAVGFERWHRIRVYDGIGGWGEPVAAPPGLAEAPLNASLESLAVLADGRWLLITEGLEHAPGLLRGWVGRPGAWVPLSYRPTPGFLPTDLAPLPDGGALLVERRFNVWERGFKGRLLHLPAARLAGLGANNEMQAEVLLDDTQLPRENWEGVSTFWWNGQQIIVMMTDDNEFFLQQGLLILFAIKPRGLAQD